jgi:hypothetical protein
MIVMLDFGGFPTPLSLTRQSTDLELNPENWFDARTAVDAVKFTFPLRLSTLWLSQLVPFAPTAEPTVSKCPRGMEM